MTYLETSRWQTLVVDVLYALHHDDTMTPSSFEPDGVFGPVTLLPKTILCRTSDSDKRLAGMDHLNTRPLAEGSWGVLHEVMGGGGVVGLSLDVAADAFAGVHALPDIVHLVAPTKSIAADAIVKPVYDGKTIRLYRLGPLDDKKPHDLVLTTKERWFRARSNPKYLGFSKDERP